jgi:hypothetical protein
MRASRFIKVSLVVGLKATRLSTTCRVFKFPMIGKELNGQAGFRLSRLFEDGPGKLVMIVDGRRHGARGIESWRARSSLSLSLQVYMNDACVCVCLCLRGRVWMRCDVVAACSLCVVEDDHHAALALIGSEFDSDGHFPRTLFFRDKSSGDLASLLPTQVHTTTSY